MMRTANWICIVCCFVSVTLVYAADGDMEAAFSTGDVSLQATAGRAAESTTTAAIPRRTRSVEVAPSFESVAPVPNRQRTTATQPASMPVRIATGTDVTSPVAGEIGMGGMARSYAGQMPMTGYQSSMPEPKAVAVDVYEVRVENQAMQDLGVRPISNRPADLTWDKIARSIEQGRGRILCTLRTTAGFGREARVHKDMKEANERNIEGADDDDEGEVSEEHSNSRHHGIILTAQLKEDGLIEVRYEYKSNIQDAAESDIENDENVNEEHQFQLEFFCRGMAMLRLNEPEIIGSKQFGDETTYLLMKVTSMPRTPRPARAQTMQSPNPEPMFFGYTEPTTQSLPEPQEQGRRTRAQSEAQQAEEMAAIIEQQMRARRMAEIKGAMEQRKARQMEIKARISELQAQREKQSEILKENHPEFQRLNGKINDLMTELDNIQGEYETLQKKLADMEN